MSLSVHLTELIGQISRRATCLILLSDVFVAEVTRTYAESTTLADRCLFSRNQPTLSQQYECAMAEWWRRLKKTAVRPTVQGTTGAALLSPRCPSIGHQSGIAPAKLTAGRRLEEGSETGSTSNLHEVRVSKRPQD
eukprot:m.282506 g.282506  ORF g.282506 m.282506 type:complete len:136 (-) comp16186_c0_seq16:6232-6639(-)